jgi:hypothetical protein
MFLVGCAHKAPNFARLHQAKTAAIISYSGEVNITDPNQAGGSATSAISAIQGMSDVVSEETEKRRLAQAEATYDVLVEKLSKGLGWTVLPRDAVTGHPSMKALYTEKMGERRPNAGIRFGVPNVPWWEFGNDLSTAQLQKLKADLGVDVLIVAKMNFTHGRTYGFTAANGAGTAEVYPKAILTFAVYDGGPEGAVWNERWIEGAIAQEKVQSTMGVVDTTNEHKSVINAAQLAADALLYKYEQVKAQTPAAAVAETGT